ncbi:hypothetical protein [Enterococcus hirae]|uniref:hypothetical protein n=1 Tax=Enterococcus hirae TaxID=1354 RepID=UPI001C8AEA18|nr:hypothetical protein [Enterococcus hirae]
MGQLAIVDADGKSLEDSSKDRTFSVNDTPQYVDSDGYMLVKTSDGKDWTWLYSE